MQFCNEHVLDPRQRFFVKALAQINGDAMNFSSRSGNFGDQNLEASARKTSRILDLLYSVVRQIRCGGVLVFFTSYQKLESFHGRITSQLEASSQFNIARKSELLQQLAPIYREQRQPLLNATDFALYQQRIAREEKAVLLAVVGGKYSEGVNFSDDLCRVLIMIGVPFDNPSLLETQKDYYDVLHRRDPQTPDGNTFYQIQCAIKVSQTLGRGVRHIEDYCMALLVDERVARLAHERNRFPAYLSEWLGEGYAGRLVDSQGWDLKRIEDTAADFWKRLQREKQDCAICLDNKIDAISGPLLVTDCCYKPMHEACYNRVREGAKRAKQTARCPYCRSQDLKVTDRIKYYDRYYREFIEQQAETQTQVLSLPLEEQ